MTFRCPVEFDFLFYALLVMLRRIKSTLSANLYLGVAQLPPRADCEEEQDLGCLSLAVAAKKKLMEEV